MASERGGEKSHNVVKLWNSLPRDVEEKFMRPMKCLEMT